MQASVAVSRQALGHAQGFRGAARLAGLRGANVPVRTRASSGLRARRAVEDGARRAQCAARTPVLQGVGASASADSHRCWAAPPDSLKQRIERRPAPRGGSQEFSQGPTRTWRAPPTNPADAAATTTAAAATSAAAAGSGAGAGAAAPAPAPAPAPAAPPAADDWSGEKVFYEGSCGSNLELALSLLLSATVIYLPLTLASIGRRLWINIKARAGGQPGGREAWALGGGGEMRRGSDSAAAVGV